MATVSNNLATENGNKMAIKFYCETCDYKCYKKYNWDTHLLTAKHIKTTNGNNLATENGKNGKKMAITCCENCGKEYKDRTGLWRHLKKCKKEKTEETEEIKEIKEIKETEELKETKDLTPIYTNNKDELINYLIKENQEFKNIILEIVKKDTITNTNNNTTHTNSHNKAFNLNFFLNETCKDAMNIMDFVESIQFQLSDLENVGEKGYIEGISNIIIKNLKNLDVTQRPVHCTDKKREIIYVKDDNKWEKDDENTKMHKMIRKVQDKNFRMIKKFKEKYPDYHKPCSKQSDVYNNIIIESMGGRGNNDYEKEEKIIKKVSKEILVEK